jgi:hypothetical protein
VQQVSPILTHSKKPDPEMDQAYLQNFNTFALKFICSI